ncbi:hypothetical protein TSL6_08660 [Sulfurovum sp. TSL6]|uniref:hypothetical protein n=1 Tax=Sulfurovum sp. TSL6 TaxID=2826995 RepID=UPI001CC79020|nr:hypothetical protein [Sulfurovum sp. TSL6]GIU00360.1 hypothetical protein TSL6_08660 [Sulfurovum sp. TSL6]
MNLEKSLQAIKTELAKRETTFKFIQQIYPYLGHLSQAEILAYFQVTTVDALDKHIQQIKSTNLHHTDHLSSENAICNCTDSTGALKTLYETQALAELEMKQLNVNNLLTLRVYACPSGNGWHLTKG